MSIEFLSAHHAQQRLIHWNQTSSDFAALLIRYGDAAPALRHFGIIHWQGGQLDTAVAAFVTALALTPADARLWSDLSAVYQAQMRPELAELCIVRSLEADPSHAAPWVQLAGLKNVRGDQAGAEADYRRALALDARLADAHFGLGLLCCAQMRLEEAVEALRLAIGFGYPAIVGHTFLGHTYYLAGEFSASAAAFETAARSGPLDSGARRKHARAITFQTMIEGRIDEALAGYPKLAGEDAEDISDILRDAFSLLSAHGYCAQATAVGARRLAEDPADPVRRYLLDAVSGRPHAAAPRDYLEVYFDRFAPDFDRKLVEVLRYCVPEQMHALVSQRRAKFASILDLGCGTGLAAASLAALGGALTGIDVSSGMLAKAAERGAYGELVRADAIGFMQSRRGGFDLVFAADTVVYMGDLGPLLEAAAGALVSGGLFALSIETTDAADFVLLPSGRFAHAPEYIARAASTHFIMEECAGTILRLEASRPVAGAMLVLKRR